MRKWSIVDHPSGAELAVLSEGVTQYGRSLALGGNSKPIACLVRESDEIVAGGCGRTEFDRLFVAYLWVKEHLRSRGLGSEVLTELEKAAHARGCKDVLIETLSDRTANLYTRLGYTSVARIPGYVGSFTKHVFVKSLGKQSGERGA
jgi:ribosomal protein S18 acetylase RimI-like enzyme